MEITGDCIEVVGIKIENTIQVGEFIKIMLIESILKDVENK